MIVLLYKLLIGHALADFPLQGDFLAKAKNHTKPVEGVTPTIPLAFHALIHAGMVWYITNSRFCAAIEFISHMLIDFLKCDGKITFTEDQALHVAFKMVYAFFINN